MKRLLSITCFLGMIGVLLGAFGAHGVRGKISDHHYDSYRTGIQYLFYHIAPLLYLTFGKMNSLRAWGAFCFVIGVIFFTGSNLLMTTEELHHVNFHFLWPVTPIGGLSLVAGWLMLFLDSLKREN